MALCLSAAASLGGVAPVGALNAGRRSRSCCGAQRAVVFRGENVLLDSARRKCRRCRAIHLGPRAASGEQLTASKTLRSQQSSWRGYNDRAGELALTLTYSATWLTALGSLRQSRVLRALKHVLVAQTALSIAVVAALKLHVARGGTAWPTFEMPHMLVSVALGLLLVHRMTHANERFWQGRRAWQHILDLCRDTARRSVTWCHPYGAAAGDPDAQETARAMGKDLAALALTLVAATEARLRSKTTLTFVVSLSALVPHSVLQRLEGSSHAPLACADEAGKLIEAALDAGFLTSERAFALDQSLQAMLLSAGECDCIARTPTPVEFSTHTSRFLTLFCFTLPFVLAPQMGWWAVVASALVTYSITAIDEISAVVESPFNGYLPMKEMFAALLKDVQSEQFVGTDSGVAKSSRLA